MQNIYGANIENILRAVLWMIFARTKYIYRMKEFPISIK
jgi:hypothetical protein